MDKKYLNLAAVVIVYNPKEFGIEKIASNIKSYAPHCKKIYIVDNSNENNEIFFESSVSTDCAYIHNGNKGGIAGAQNVGCSQALTDGFDWAMTMDQDSFFEKEQINGYINFVSDYIEKYNNAASFAPKIIDLNESRYWTHLLRKHVLGHLKRKILHKELPKLSDIEFPTEVIASANIIHLPTWQSVGKFDESLFIEQVDYDFCHNLIKNGHKIVKFNAVFLNQYFGKRVFALFKKNYPWYNNFRMYYVFRNLFIEKQRFPEYEKKYNKILRMRFVDYCVNTIHPISHFCNFLKAWRDYKSYMEKSSAT